MEQPARTVSSGWPSQVLFALTLLAAATVVSAAPADPVVPMRAASQLGNSVPPLWIAAEEMVNEEGEIEWSEIRFPMARMIQQGADRECAEIGPIEADYAIEYPHQTLDDIEAHAKILVRGRVVAVTPGFYFSMPGVLLTVQVFAVDRGPDELVAGEMIHAFYQKGRFRLGNIWVCALNPLLPDPPGIGDQVMLFPFFSPSDLEGLIYSLNYREIVFEDQSGQIMIPPEWGTSSGFRDIGSLDRASQLLASANRD